MSSHDMQPSAPFVHDEHLLDDADEYGTEQRLDLDTGDPNLRAALVVRDDDLEFIELTWFRDPGLTFPASPATVEDVLQRAAKLGYPLTLVMRRGVALDDAQRFVERLVVYFDPEPSAGDGTGVEVRVDVGIDLEDEDYGNPKEAAVLRDRWAARVEEVLRQQYPEAGLHVRRIDDDAEEIEVTTPFGIDPTDFEWAIEDLIEQAKDEVLGDLA